MTEENRCSNCLTTLLAARLHISLSHGLPSLFWTSLSAAAGLLPSLASPVLAIRRFAAFSILLITCCFFYTLTIVPLALATRNRFFSTKCSNWLIRTCPSFGYCSFSAASILRQLKKSFSQPISGALMPITLYRSCSPQQIFLSQRPWFFFDRTRLKHTESVYFIWGLKSMSLGFGNWWFKPLYYPFSNSRLGIDQDTQSDFVSTESRRFVIRFCNRLHRAPHIAYTTHAHCPLARLTSLACIPSSSHTLFRSPCCLSKARPIDFLTAENATFLACLRHLDSGYLFSFPKIPTGDNNKMASNPYGLVISTQINLSSFSSGSSELAKAYTRLEIWLNESLASAPAGLRRGFMVSRDLMLLDLISSLAGPHFIFICLVLPAIIAAGVVFLAVVSASWSTPSSKTASACLLAGLAGVCLTGGLTTALALCCILDSWRTGITEAVVLSLAAGLAIDPCIHLVVGLAHAKRPGTVTSDEQRLPNAQQCTTFSGSPNHACCNCFATDSCMSFSCIKRVERSTNIGAYGPSRHSCRRGSNTFFPPPSFCFCKSIQTNFTLHTPDDIPFHNPVTTISPSPRRDNTEANPPIHVLSTSEVVSLLQKTDDIQSNSAAKLRKHSCLAMTDRPAYEMAKIDDANDLPIHQTEITSLGQNVESIIISEANDINKFDTISHIYTCRQMSSNENLSCCAWSDDLLKSATLGLGYAVRTTSASTALMGLAMLPSSLLAYRRIGLFLPVLMACAYLFCYLFLISMLRCLDKLRARLISSFCRHKSTSHNCLQHNVG
ncbi:unnamed protein product [Protopolystoma xenopodis]|uniref:SSD domain-containing protein n=1 Tax=Protopolystoma xenopodis TaxID=117903 RepID=A0A448WDG1_9PLAT|nr:unnamed protein product [Protopolystoma xenopodis]